MKKQLLTILITAAISIALFGGTHTPTLVQPATATAQSSSPRGDLITATRLDVANFNAAMDSFLGHRAEYVGRAFNYVSGDMVGSNNSTSFTADDVDQCMTDFNTVIGVVRAGGTLSAGVWPNVIKIK